MSLVLNKISNSKPTPIYSKFLYASVLGFGAFGVIGTPIGVCSDLLGLGVGVFLDLCSLKN